MRLTATGGPAEPRPRGSCNNWVFLMRVDNPGQAKVALASTTYWNGQVWPRACAPTNCQIHSVGRGLLDHDRLVCQQPPSSATRSTPGPARGRNRWVAALRTGQVVHTRPGRIPRRHRIRGVLVARAETPPNRSSSRSHGAVSSTKYSWFPVTKKESLARHQVLRGAQRHGRAVRRCRRPGPRRWRPYRRIGARLIIARSARCAAGRAADRRWISETTAYPETVESRIQPDGAGSAPAGRSAGRARGGAVADQARGRRPGGDRTGARQEDAPIHSAVVGGIRRLRPVRRPRPVGTPGALCPAAQHQPHRLKTSRASSRYPTSAKPDTQPGQANQADSSIPVNRGTTQRHHQQGGQHAGRPPSGPAGASGGGGCP